MCSSDLFPEPVALTTVAAMVPEHEVKILDMRLEADTVFNETLLSFRPQLVGTTSMTTDRYQAKALLTCTKQTLGRDCFPTVGGHHATFAPHDFEDADIDALCIGEGDETFAELIQHLDGGGSFKDLSRIDGLRYELPDGAWHSTKKRNQDRDLDTFPAPRRDLLPRRYRDEYFFAVAGPMASMATSRGCSFDCNFCATWEFYEHKTRFLPAEKICDQIETMDEKVVFFLDDNFLTSKHRMLALADEMEKRGIKKWWGTQGRTDFVADHPDVMKTQYGRQEPQSGEDSARARHHQHRHLYGAAGFFRAGLRRAPHRHTRVASPRAASLPEQRRDRKISIHR
mgnify:CR=1 FL=1